MRGRTARDVDKPTIDLGDDSLDTTGEGGILTFGIACCLGAIVLVLAVAAGWG